MLGVTVLSSGTEVRTEDGRNKQLETPVQVLVSVVFVVSLVTATSGHSAPAATATVDEGTTARKKAKNEMTAII